MLNSIMTIRGEPLLRRFMTTPASLCLLGLNVVGSGLYLAGASKGWATPEEHGEIPITGEPFVWFAMIFPVVVFFLLLNVSWGAIVLRYKEWRFVRYWLGIIPLWLITLWVDFSHH